MQNILMIEDDRPVAELYKSVLERHGFHVEIASDGEQGLLRAQNEDFDLIILDLLLPRISGLDVLAQLKAAGSKTASTPVFVLTNVGQESYMKRAFELGAQSYIVKASVLPQDVAEEIRKFLSTKQF